MKRGIVSATLLLLCFSLLAVLSGVLPVIRVDAASTEASGEMSAGEAVEPDTDTPAPEPTSPETAAPAPTPEPTEEPAATEAAAPRLIATTITGEGPMDNDTYYDIDPAELLEGEAPLSLPREGYQVLILHTHTTEAYTPDGEDRYEESDEYRTTDPEHSVVRVGTELAAALEEQGLSVLHDTQLHDYPSYTGAYERSGAAVRDYLEAYPSLRLVIDLHRDALGDGEVIYKTLADIDGVEAAQVMFVMGSDVNLDHPAWRENLRLALTIQAAVDRRYPSLMRPTVLCDNRYNQQLAPGCLLLEVGTSGNTLAEAIAGARLFAQAAGPLLSGWVED